MRAVAAPLGALGPSCDLVVAGKAGMDGLWSADHVYMILAGKGLKPWQRKRTPTEPGLRYPVKGETAVCPLCNGLFVLKKPKFCPIEQKWKPGEFRKHTCVSVHAIMPTN